MTTRHAATDLLAEVARTLREDVAPALAGEERLKTLMAARAARIALAEFCESDAIGAAAARLARFGEPQSLRDRIRAGAHDDDEALHGALLAQARIFARIAQA
jgi:hypothetical protein